MEHNDAGVEPVLIVMLLTSQKHLVILITTNN